MELKIAKWGNSLAVRLPSSIAKQMQIQDGDSVEVSLNPQGELVLAPQKSFDKTEFIQDLLALQQALPETTSVIEVMRNQERY
ncbi:AbrB/MazE/SpoVT family DNA-binding domain-containing protein [Methylophilus aquaticus]|uniref:AbrB/MazE/SpoVT family DNA-binding domain-containing protein n=1 Tax=Methylophilus aquaticus TaxID=1971610 RepID=A0ABT9JNW4_9PROT|nr:AbrB/MazE/SpoVT family DNA-binding domain-containing protein [Methylophilus aquaticus]MDP8566277.1 AbrB/MazE/SpoVT family DNA-binding domain-containing protein [Methylophilus aquaticus]